MEGGSNSTPCKMAFEDNSNGLCPMMMMMMPLMSSSHHHHHDHDHHNDRHHHHPDADSSTLFLPLPSTNNQTQNRNSSSGFSSPILDDNNITNTGCCFMETHDGTSSTSSVKAKIMAHPYYHRLLAAYSNCQKVGAPPEVVARLEEACASAASIGPTVKAPLGEDPALDQFMEAYCDMLTKYEQELSKPIKEAMLFLQRIECQFKALTVSPSNSGDI